MYHCASCKSGIGKHHVTVTVEVFKDKATVRKISQFWLCDDCELLSREVLAKDDSQKGRVAKLLCTVPPKAWQVVV